MTRKEEFIKEMKHAIKTESYFYLINMIDNAEEIIIFKPHDVVRMLNYYVFQYEDDLTSATYTNIKITEFKAVCKDCIISMIRKWV